MSGINVGRWLVGGVVAGILIWIFEGLASLFYVDEMQAALDQHGLSMAMSAQGVVTSTLVSLIAGLTLVFFYAAARPRFGAGPRTAVVVAVALWVGGYLLSLLGYQMMGLFPARLLVIWGAIGLVEMIVASVVGSWIYRES